MNFFLFMGKQGHVIIIVMDGEDGLLRGIRSDAFTAALSAIPEVGLSK